MHFCQLDLLGTVIYTVSPILDLTTDLFLRRFDAVKGSILALPIEGRLEACPKDGLYGAGLLLALLEVRRVKAGRKV